MKTLYFDYNATTPCDPMVVEAMQPYWNDKFGNASSSNHSYGWAAQAAVTKARRLIAQLLAAKPQEIYFTSGATESNNMAILGVINKFLCPKHGETQKPHIITSNIEHKAVYEVCSNLEDWGVEVTYLPVDKQGMVSPEEVEKAIQKNTKLISIMFANNEIGTLNPIKEIGKIAKKHHILFHTDAAQAIGKLNINVEELHIDMMSISGHKFYAPKGIGVLYVRSENPKVELVPLQFGGSQEDGLRPGTLNVPCIVGLAKALEISIKELPHERERLSLLRKKLQNAITQFIPEARFNGHPEERLFNNLSVTFPGFTSEQLSNAMDGIAFSYASACSSTQAKPSYVLKAIGLSDKDALATVRFGLGRYTKENDIDEVVEKIKVLK